MVTVSLSLIKAIPTVPGTVSIIEYNRSLIEMLFSVLLTLHDVWNNANMSNKYINRRRDMKGIVFIVIIIWKLVVGLDFVLAISFGGGVRKSADNFDCPPDP